MVDEPEKVDLESPDLAAQRRAALEELFPGAIADGVLDAARIGELVDVPVAQVPDGRERYGLQWAGKQEAIRSLLTPSRGTLVPDRNESINFDTAENVFIEGDNLEVLKLLQKAYNDRVKLIYIDPPYNTGNDFVYDDDFTDGLRGYLEYTGQLDEDGNRTAADVDKAGRRHSRWLNMMHPRLVLARNLLRQDGAIFISIDDNEQSNLMALMDEIFGEENRLGTICVKMSHLSGMKMGHAEVKLPKLKEFLVCYARDRATFRYRPVRVPVSWDEAFSRYTSFLEFTDEEDLNTWKRVPLREAMAHVDAGDREQWLLDHADRVFRTAVNDSLSATPRDGVFRRLTTPTGLQRIAFNGEEVIFAESKLTTVDGRQVPGAPVGDIWTDIGINNLHNEGGVPFPNGKKPLKLIRRVLELTTSDQDLVMDFFAGSGSAGQAVLEQNRADGHERRFVLVNLPESVTSDAALSAAGYETVADVCRDRLVKAAATHENGLGGQLKLYALAQSNFRAATVSEDQLDLQEFTLDHAEQEWDSIAAEALLKEGVPLGASWRRTTVAGANAIVAGNVAVVLSLEITDDIVAAALSLDAAVVVFMEDGFRNADAVKANAVTNSRGLNKTMKTV